MILIVVIIFILVAGGAFYGGMKYNSVKKTMYPRQIRISDIHSISAPTSKTPGIEAEVKYVYSGKENSLLKNIIGDLNKKKIDDLNSELNSLKLKLSLKEQDLRDNSESIEKAVKRSSDIRKAAKTTDDNENNFSSFRNRIGGIIK